MHQPMSYAHHFCFPEHAQDLSPSPTHKLAPFNSNRRQTKAMDTRTPQLGSMGKKSEAFDIF